MFYLVDSSSQYSFLKIIMVAYGIYRIPVMQRFKGVA